MNLKDKTPLLTGSIPKHMARLGLPILIAMSFQTLYVLVDLFWVDKLGGKAVAAMAIATQAFFIALMVGHSIGVGAIALLSQSWGRKAFDEARRVFAQVVWATCFVGLALWGLGYLFAEAYVQFFTTDATTIELGLQYFRTYSATFFVQLLTIVLGFCFRGIGDFMTPMKFMLTAVVLNLVLDPLLIFGYGPFPEWGLFGAAIATVFSQVVAAIGYAAVILSRKKAIYFTKEWQLDLKTVGHIFKIGLPSGVQYMILAAMLVITYRWIRPLGPFATAAVGIGFRLMHATYLPMIACAASTSTLAGQNFGAGLMARVRSTLKWGLVYSNAWSFSITAALMLFPTFFVGIFASEPAVLDYGTVYLRYFGATNFAVASVFISTAMFQGLGRTMLPLVGALIKITVYGAAWAILAGQTPNLKLICLAVVFGTLLECIWDLTLALRVSTKATPLDEPSGEVIAAPKLAQAAK